jgi:ribosome-associated toxin RatA of RatAB toxin-antitoxin module
LLAEAYRQEAHWHFCQRATELKMVELNLQFQSSAVVIADIFTIVYIFTSA